MKTKKLSNTQQRRMKRDDRIVELYKRNKDRYANAMDLYEYIGSVVKWSHMTIIRVLQERGEITPKKQRQ